MRPEQAAAQVLEQRHGLCFEGVAARRLERALQAAAAAAGRSVEDHATGLADDPAAVADLVDRATLPETSWFRDPGLFEAVVQHAAGAVAAAALDGTRATLWSAGCAHGQEAYSLAIGLLERGLLAFDVVATDVAPAAVAHTEAATYPERALRGLAPRRRDRWLEPAGDGLWRVRDEVRDRVRVRRHGLVTERPPVGAGTTSLVLCRNVLIYLAPEAIERALVQLRSALAPAGLLVLGAGEAVVRRVEGLRPVPLGTGFAYAPEPAAAPEAEAQAPSREAVPPAPPVLVPPAPSPFGALIAEGEAAAAAGDHAGAAAAFRHAAALDPGAPLAHFGLGVALEALGDPGAARAFRAALGALDRPGAVLAEDLGGFTVDELARMLAARATGATR